MDTLTSYCFLAALTENQNDLYNHVFVPICKRALSLYCLRGNTCGKAEDIQHIIHEEYGLDVPIVVIRRLITSVLESLSRRQKDRFGANVFEHGNAFQIKQYSFSDLEEKYKKGLRDANRLHRSFQNYLYSEQIEPNKLPSFSEFLDKNKRQIASFFKGNGSIKKNDVDQTFLYHVEFLEHINTFDDDLFRVAEQLYLGSIVAGFLESGLDLAPKFTSDEVYYIDTPLILKALDLQKEEDTKPALELLNLIKDTGGKLKILSITIDELRDVINNAIETYSSNNPITTINDACIRLGKNKVWLIQISAKIETYVFDKLQISIDTISPALLEKFEKSSDINALKDTRKRKGNAFHDVAAYLFVRAQRGTTINSFQKGKYWFVTSNYDLLIFNKEHSPINGVTEIVLPDALTSMLWLKDPAKLTEEVKKVGLRELMATTLNEEIASKELIGEFETAISTLEDVSKEDYQILLESVAHQSAKKIIEFNEVAAQDKTKAKQNAINIIEKEKTRKAKQVRQIKDAHGAEKREKDANAILNKRIEELENEGKKYKTEIEKLSTKITDNTEYVKRVFIWFFITVILVWIAIWGFTNYSTQIFKIVSWVASSGGLWGLGSFVLNLIKICKGTK